MTATVAEEVDSAEPTTQLAPLRALPSPRPVESCWSVTCLDREQVWAQLTHEPFAAAGRKQYPDASRSGVGRLLDWLGDQPGRTWQDQWRSSGVEAGGRAWRQVPTAWLNDHGHNGVWERDSFFVALCSADPDVSAAAATRTAYRATLILAAKGGILADITAGDVLELLDTEADHFSTKVGATHLFYRIMHAVSGFGSDVPATLRQLRAGGQRTPDELIDRYRIACRPIRNLLVDYLRERQPALDYASLDSLATMLGKLFWADLERHHAGIDSLHLRAEVADAWKQRLRTVTKTTRTSEGKSVRTAVERINYRECLTPVRGFYLDLAHWAVEDPARWGPWVVPCPVGAEEVNRRKVKRHRKSRMDARTRERLPVLPVLVDWVDTRRRHAAAMLDAARRAEPGKEFTAAGQRLIRIAPTRSAAAKIWAQDPVTGRRRELAREEEHAFWAFAAVEVLRHTGIRIEELTELSHHSLVQYRLPTTGEVVPLLQIVPSKTDEERLLVVSPELAEVLSAIISRVRSATGAVPLIAAYDRAERVWSAPAPLLFQRRYGHEHRAISDNTIRDMLTAAIDHIGLTDPATDEPLHFTPHDFRRLFITDAVLNGLPPHIAQVIAGHRDIRVTLGYKAVYPDEAIQSHLAFLARRRAMRPTDEYRVPTDEEWQQFLGHFERRKVSVGTCGRAFGSACIHEHACVRCALLWPDPAQRVRMLEIRDNLKDRIAEAEREGWLGEVDGLQVSLAGAEDKLAQVDRHLCTNENNAVKLGMPAIPGDS